MLLKAISFIRPQYAPLHFTTFSLAGSVIRGHLLRRRPLIPSHKAKPPASAQLLRMLHQLAFISFHFIKLFSSSFTQSLTQPSAAHIAYSTFMRVRLLSHSRTIASRTLAHTQFNATATRKSTVLPRYGLRSHSSSIVTIIC
jgi:hypothetical protein